MHSLPLNTQLRRHPPSIEKVELNYSQVLQAETLDALCHLPTLSQATAVITQGHVDMVTEKNNDVNHDFFNDPLRLQSDGSWLKVHPHCLEASAAPCLWHQVVLPCHSIRMSRSDVIRRVLSMRSFLLPFKASWESPASQPCMHAADDGLQTNMKACAAAGRRHDAGSGQWYRGRDSAGVAGSP